MDRLLSKGMSNIYLKVTIETFSKLIFWGELQLMQISLNFQTIFSVLKI